MIRGIYTGASGMSALQFKMDVLANNIANVDKTGFKKDEVLYKSFPEMLLHRSNDDGVGWTPMGSFDTTPIVGKLGTGLEVNETYVRHEQGGLKNTNVDTDIAINGEGFLMVQTNRGAKLSRNGTFILNKDGYLVTAKGFPLLGENGPIQVNRNNFLIKTNGEVWINNAIGNDPSQVYGKDLNQWEDPVLLDKIQIRKVDYPRYLVKEGESFYQDTSESGEPRDLHNDETSEILQGYLEVSNVNIVREMVDMIEVQRAYEMNERSIRTHDEMLGRLINEVAR